VEVAKMTYEADCRTVRTNSDSCEAFRHCSERGHGSAWPKLSVLCFTL